MDVLIDRSSERTYAPWGAAAGRAHFPWATALPPQLVLAFATIEKRVCDFSTFPGKMRLFTLLHGRCHLSVGTTSKHPQSIQLEGKYPRCSFDASVPTICTLFGKNALAFNLIYEISQVRAESTILDAKRCSRRFQEDSTLLSDMAERMSRRFVFVLCLCGRTKVEFGSAGPIPLEAHDLLRVDTAPSSEAMQLRFTQGAELLVAQVVL